MIRGARLSVFTITAIVVLALPLGSMAQEKELTQIKERELEEVREKISDLKKSMDRRASERDRVTGELQSAEIQIAEKRVVLRDLERQRDFSEKKKADIEQRLDGKESELAVEAEQLAAQVTGQWVGHPDFITRH